jgi:hypothetical protein
MNPNDSLVDRLAAVAAQQQAEDSEAYFNLIQNPDGADLQAAHGLLSRLGLTAGDLAADIQAWKDRKTIDDNRVTQAELDELMEGIGQANKALDDHNREAVEKRQKLECVLFEVSGRLGVRSSEMEQQKLRLKKLRDLRPRAFRDIELREQAERDAADAKAKADAEAARAKAAEDAAKSGPTPIRMEGTATVYDGSDPKLFALSMQPLSR